MRLLIRDNTEVRRRTTASLQRLGISCEEKSKKKKRGNNDGVSGRTVPEQAAMTTTTRIE